jgi:predicted ATP-grasp superfamily ATP-dependent carboligase
MEDAGAIVLGTEVNGIAVIRSLGRLKVRVGAITFTTRGDHAHSSRYLRYCEVLSASATDSEILDALIHASERLGPGKPVVIPTTDRFAECLSRNAQALAQSFLPCCPDSDLCDAFLDKWKTARICHQNGIQIPFTACPGTPEEAEELAARIRFPVIVKPRYTFGTGFPGKNAVFNDPTELKSFFLESGLYGRCVVQQVIASGDGDILVVATYSGVERSVRAVYSGRKIRQLLPDYGATCFGLSERHKDLEDGSCRFLDAIGYRGFAALEFARSRTDGKKYFIELNTRTYYHNQLFSDAGIDLTQVAYLLSTGRDPESVVRPLRQREGLYWLDFRRDFQSMRLKRAKGQITLFGWLRSILRARSFAYWNWRDPLPFFHGCVWRTGDILRNLAARLIPGRNREVQRHLRKNS